MTKRRRKKLPPGTFLYHTNCEKCGSSDANAVYDNGTTYCWSCKEPGTLEGAEVNDVNDETSEGFESSSKSWASGSAQDIKKRGLREAVCQKFGYLVGEHKGKPCHIMNYRDPKTGKLIAQKIRFSNKPDGKKDITTLGNGKNLPFYGQHLYSGGKRLVITEGEIDALSVAQVMGDGKWPVVSLPNGVSSAVPTVEANLEWLDTFEEIVLCFDQDEQGRQATEEVLPLLPPGKAYLMTLPYKDANETLLEAGPQAISDAFWNRQLWRPDGIISGSEISLEDLMEGSVPGYSTPYPKFDELYGGIRPAELLLLTAGSGIGKSTLARELGYHLHQAHGLTIGNVYLEESHKKTAQGYIAIDNNVPLGKLRADTSILSIEAWQASREKVIADRMYFYNHFGSLESDRLLTQLRYMAVALKCDFIILDHISIVVSGQEGSGEGERRDIDMLMTKLRSLVEETGVGIIAIVHLKQPEGKAHEEGGRVSLNQLRGSGSLKQLSDGVVGLERNQQDEENAHISVMRILKNREHGSTGAADVLEYNRETGRLLPADGYGDFGDLDL
ncbi:twinkle protein [Microvirga flocculans]|uniref:Twinkle protein n=1 Tax=Microvirga flocculans TaxID=217168 RepID=A0A7W6N703_9HYPH|nr:DnaB-like helicase C-terminal domain-containing protein [Microvirga flocculans]MBB4039136.1 twinkle protein [Microvirga flocculans]